MKKVLILWILAFVSLGCFAQDKKGVRKVYCELLGTQKFMSSKVIVSVDFGQETSFWTGRAKQYLVDGDGRAINFNSMVDAMNFMGELGWKFEQAYVVTTSNQNVYHWLLSKDITDGGELEKGLNTKEKFENGDAHGYEETLLGMIDDVECRLIEELNNGVCIRTSTKLNLEQVKRVKKELNIKKEMIQLYLPGKNKRNESYAGASNSAIFNYEDGSVIELKK